jgi:hypothetical protein
MFCKLFLVGREGNRPESQCVSNINKSSEHCVLVVYCQFKTCSPWTNELYRHRTLKVGFSFKMSYFPNFEEIMCSAR